MPNWCRNALEVRGKRADVERFRALAAGTSDQPASSGGPGITAPMELVEVRFPGGDEPAHTPRTQPAEAPPEPDGAALRLANLMPPPPGADWYSWNRANWGCKWDVDHLSVTPIRRGRRYDFSTANEPPIAWVERVCRWFPELEFRFGAYEGDGAIAEVRVCRDGVVELSETLGVEQWPADGWRERALAMFEDHDLPSLADRVRGDIEVHAEWEG